MTSQNPEITIYNIIEYIGAGSVNGRSKIQVREGKQHVRTTLAENTGEKRGKKGSRGSRPGSGARNGHRAEEEGDVTECPSGGRTFNSRRWVWRSAANRTGRRAITDMNSG
jgi:hypothetical protein